MRHLTALSLIAGLLTTTGCEDSDDPVDIAQTRVVSDGSSSSFEEVILLVNLQDENGNPILVSHIDSITLFVNGEFWATVSTDTIDTSIFEQSESGDFLVTNRKVSHYASSRQQNVDGVEFFQTAGEFALLLNESFDLDPGEYLCLVSSVKLRDKDGNLRTFHPYVYQSFTVDENQSSAYLGEIDITLN